MIEDLAINLFFQEESFLLLIDIGLFVLGAIFAVIVSRSMFEIARAPYFAYSALLYFAVSAVQIVWLQILPAMSGGYVWALFAVSVVASIAAGYFFCLIALARSRDAYGHGRLAFLGFIPIVNFWLLLTPSKNEISANRLAAVPLLSGGLGVLTGFVLFAAGTGVASYIEAQGRMMEQQAQTESGAQQIWVRSIIGRQGLEETLRTMAAEAQTPIAIDDVTTLERIEASGAQLRRTYIVDFEGMTMTEDFRTLSRNSICAWQAFEPILRARGSIREVYVERSGREIGSVLITREECGF